MNRIHTVSTFLLAGILPFAGVLVIASCAPTGTYNQESAAQTGAGELLPGSDAAGAPMVTFEFPDLPVPVELKKVEDKTMILKTNQFRGGLLMMTGRVTADSLVDFFTRTMPRYGWELKGTINAKRSLLAFSKGSGSHCLIEIDEGSMGFSTDVQIWVLEALQEL